MHGDSIPIPAERIPPVATDASSSAKVWAGVLLFVAAIFAIGIFGGLGDDNLKLAKDSAERAGNYVGMMIVVAVPGLIGLRFARGASRATRAAELAKTGGYTWQLAGKWIVAADSQGVPRPDVSFKINEKLRTMLLAVPRAEVTRR